MNESMRNGLSMLEITLAMGILAMIMLPVFMTFSSGNRNMQMTESEFRAHTMALELMEQIVSLPFKLIPAGSIPGEKIINGKPLGPGPAVFKINPLDEYLPEVKIEEIKRNQKTLFKKVTVKIRFPAAKKSERIREFELKTLIANENI